MRCRKGNSRSADMIHLFYHFSFYKNVYLINVCILRNEEKNKM